ncbi:MAG: hypothetical protein KDK51_06810, partial [Deltaproteobacteria bacterium]|nr:hypothetical protein [Deltaproteobacteria bacterium]
MKNMIQAGQVYEYKDFEPVSKDYKRNTAILIKEGVLVRVHPGIFFAPKKGALFGSFPPEQELIHRFLNDDHFVIYSLNHFNGLGLGTTQLYNKTVVFNRKRHGV